MAFRLKYRPGRYAVTLASVVLGTGVILAMTPTAGMASAQAPLRPSAGGALESEFYGVSCTSASACTAAGDYETSAGVSVTLAERWNGTAWTVQSTPAPSGAQASYLNGVSCTSATACTAVGHYVSSAGGSVTLAEVWNGSAWTVQSTPNPSGATGSFLDAVSCTSASACTAVGYDLTSTGAAALTEVWNGTAWTIQSIPAPSGATADFLDGVSCTSASACTATGYYANGTGDATLAEVWNGSAWTIQTTPNPSGATDTELYGVSCTSASACTATGYYTSGTSEMTLAEVWNGSAWTIQTTPNESGATATFLDGVSCTSASACTATGWYETTPNAYQTLAERWNGSAWTIQTTPNPSGATDSYLFGVSCTSAPTCAAVGYDLTSKYNALVEGWNGSAWAIQTTPNP